MPNPIQEVQGQAIDSPIVMLVDIQISEDPDVYIHIADTYYIDTTKITMRDYDANGTINTYHVIPTSLEGLDKSLSGSLPRPTITIANVFKTETVNSILGAMYVGNSNETLNFNDILGLKIRIRRTLKKYLYNVTSATPPTEFPVEEFFLDRVIEETKEHIVFELVSPFDLVKVRLPGRIIVSNGCPWRYTASGDHKLNYEKVGGCRWNQESKIIINAVEYIVYVNKDDEYILPDSVSFTSDPGGTRTANTYYSTTETGLTKISSTLTRSTDNSQLNYWRCRNNTTDTPADNHADWMRVRVYDSPYNDTATAYNVYTDDKYNHYATQAADETVKDVESVSVLRLWQKKYRTMDASDDITPGPGPEWARGDLCGKTLTSCTRRFGVVITSGTPNATQNEEIIKPFGGFPTARGFS